MINLTFGEQVKIILSRKGMTIKELAEIMEQRMGKKMSRQNMTQRLGRDNFQEQDMRMIADILGCPFQLSILADSESVERALNIEEVSPTEKELSKLEKLKEKKEKKMEKKVVKLELVQEAETGRDITIGELVDIHQELDELIEQGTKEQPVAKMSVEEIMEEVEAIEKENRFKTTEEKATELKGMEGDKKSRGWKAYLKRRTNQMEEELLAEGETIEASTVEVETEVIEGNVYEAHYEPEDDYVDFETREVREVVVEEVSIMEEDAVSKGDVNPYTRNEFETNSVRVHPKRIGYVQVYDRSDHRWTDMTEWAFLGYQERKKALLGKDYEPPVYLD